MTKAGANNFEFPSLRGTSSGHFYAYSVAVHFCISAVAICKTRKLVNSCRKPRKLGVTETASPPFGGSVAMCKCRIREPLLAVRLNSSSCLTAVRGVTRQSFNGSIDDITMSVIRKSSRAFPENLATFIFTFLY